MYKKNIEKLLLYICLIILSYFLAKTNYEKMHIEDELKQAKTFCKKEKFVDGVELDIKKIIFSKEKHDTKKLKQRLIEKEKEDF